MDFSVLTKGQKEVYQKFVQFLLDPKENNLIIQGSAGTGKSFLTKYLVEEGIKNYRAQCNVLGLPIKYKDYDVCATTHKAVESLSNQITLPNGKPIVTLASLLGLRVWFNYEKQKEELVDNGNQTTVIREHIVFIDECSMISKDAFEFINLKLVKCKVIFIGDKYQLPPVKEKLSAIYSCHYPEVELTELVRNAGKPALMELCEQLKDTCKTGEWKDIHSVPGSIEVIKDNFEMEKLFRQMFKEPNVMQRVIAYSNKIVVAYAQYISELRGEKDYLTEGEWYVSNAYYAHSSFQQDQRLHIESPVMVVEIREVPDERIYSDQFGITNEEIISQKPLKYVKFYSPNLHLYWWDYVFATPEYYLEYLKSIHKQSVTQWNYIKSRILDLRKADSCTIHKAQGATLDTVLIDLYDISHCKQKEQTARLLYVAASRAKNKVIFYGELNKRYGVNVA